MSQQINLYNPAFIPPREIITARSLAIATAAALFVVIVGMLWAQVRAAGLSSALLVAQAARAKAQTDLDAARAALESRKPSAEISQQVDRARAKLALRERILTATHLNLAEPGSGFSKFLTGLARQGVSGLWLTELGIDADGKNLTLSGQTLRQEAVPDYVRRLKAEPVFAGKTFAGIEMTGPEPALAVTAAPGAVPPAQTTGSPTPTSATTVATPAVSVPVFGFRLLATPVSDAGVKR